MKSLILLEYHFLQCDDGQIYCDRVIDYNYLKRYLKCFDNIILCGRVKKYRGDFSDKLLVSGNNVEFVGLPEFVGIKGIIKNYFKIMKVIKSLIKRVDCCIMRAPNHLSLITYKTFKKEKLPFALEFNIAADKFVEGKGLLKKIINKAVVSRTKKMCLSANGVSYVTNRILQLTYPCKAIIEGESNDYFTASYSTIELNDSMIYNQNWDSKKPPKVFEIIHTGYMDSYRKGHISLLNSLNYLIKNGYTNFHLTLVGDGIKREEFEQFCIDNNLTKYVTFTGLIKNKNEITDLLKKCHFFVFPTQSEGLPRSIIEAMATGLVCVSSPVDGIPELLDEEFMIDYNDYESYAKKILALSSKWEKMIEISKSNSHFVKKFDKKALSDKRTEFYEKLKNCAKRG